MSQRRLPAEIYWRRRLLVLAAVIALVWLALRFVGGDDKPDPKPTAQAPATTTAAPPVVAPVNGVVNVTLVSASRACDPEKIRMTPTVEPGQFTKAPVTIGLVVSSTEKTACTLTPADADLVAVISANKTPIWDSTVCKVALLDDPVSISPQWASLVTATWSGRGSGSKCSAKEGYATPGTYTVQIGTLGGEPGKTSFTLDRRPQPKPSKTTPTKPTPSAKNTTKPND
ncbi:hypothetical protein [Aeromicrobium sp. 9AM]|uniref:hypothetical protein n=1 Tax=Aeromicrobium sp. 9AM TaxID=2653126 RepID=UPI0012F44E83|nr:hypothetical protein [Aeromicrobium sp. 9AM]VXC36084.1 conserved hypothetical protein [Aeromicrobium sp. 9AM]